MLNLKGIEVGSFIARRELVALLGDKGYRVIELIRMGSSVYVEVEQEGSKNLLEFELGNLHRDETMNTSEWSYRELFKPVTEVLDAQVLRFKGTV